MSDKQKPGPKRKSVEVSPYNGIQANHCKNPSCENFTVGYEDDPNDPNYLRSGSTQVTPPIFRDDNLKLKHPALGRPNATLFIQCRKCSATLPLKNNEVYKSFSHMTDMGRKSLKRKALYLSKATLHPVDNYFMRVRRRVSQLERGIPTAYKDRRIWYGKCFYRPDMVKKVSMVLMTYLNYVSLEGKKTPAEKLGVAKGSIRLRDILSQ